MKIYICQSCFFLFFFLICCLLFVLWSKKKKRRSSPCRVSFFPASPTSRQSHTPFPTPPSALHFFASQVTSSHGGVGVGGGRVGGNSWGPKEGQTERRESATDAFRRISHPLFLVIQSPPPNFLPPPPPRHAIISIRVRKHSKKNRHNKQTNKETKKGVLPRSESF